jgi:hypothetical protein
VTDTEIHLSGLARSDLLELTVAGLRALASHLGLSLASAVSHHGLAGGGPESPLWLQSSANRADCPCSSRQWTFLTTAEHGPFDRVWRIPGGHNDRCAWPNAVAGS